MQCFQDWRGRKKIFPTLAERVTVRFSRHFHVAAGGRTKSGCWLVERLTLKTVLSRMRSDKNMWLRWSDLSRVTSKFRRIYTAFRWSYLLICKLVVHATRDTLRWLFYKYILDLYVFHLTSVEERKFRQRTTQVRLRILVSEIRFGIVGWRVLLLSRGFTWTDDGPSDLIFNFYTVFDARCGNLPFSLFTLLFV